MDVPKLLLPFLALTTFYFALSPPLISVKADPALDVKSLIFFKECIQNDPYMLLADWRPDSPNACNWTGVKCSHKHPGKVISVKLHNSALQGSISPHLANISFLEVLDLSQNSLRGQIPLYYGRLTRLNHLDLSNNAFDGPIPQELGNLSCLHVLALSSNFFVGSLPASLARLKSLTSLKVSNNKLSSSIPEQLGHLSTLKKLDLSTNFLKGSIPMSIGTLAHLKHLRLYQNSLTGSFPETLTNLSCLEELDFLENALVGAVPVSIARLKNLISLNLGKNFFHGSIPRSITNITFLTFFNLNYNRMQGDLPTWIANFANLQQLHLAFNQFTGAIPDSWENATQLVALDLSSNHLKGTLPLWLGNFVKLERLHLSVNNFKSGTAGLNQPIPILKALFNCSDLQHLYISYTHLNGILPFDIGSHWPSLREIYLMQNVISGSIPNSMANFSSLMTLELGYNLLGGTIPALLGHMRSIQYLGLSHNKLQGSIPAEVGNANRTLAYLYLQGNQLSGTIPPSIGELANLRNLSLSMNSLSGEIPFQLGKCSLLEHFSVSANNLSGPIPPQVAGLRNIQFEFNLSKNELSGEVPPEIAGLQMAQRIDLSSNQLSGNIAVFMVQWVNAIELNFSFNNFSGRLPENLGEQLTQLTSIDLSYNDFRGPVPESLFDSPGLHFLNISCNNFEGEIFCSNVAFSNLSRSSFLGNPLLCGRCMGLPSCNQSSHTTSTFKVGLISILCGFFLVSVLISLFYTKIKNFFLETTYHGTLEKYLMQISLEEIQRATGNFSAANLVGQGRNGQVYLGVLSYGERVVVKLFWKGEEESFKRECQILGRIRHRNLSKVLNVVWLDDLKAIVMPYFSNGNLHSLLYDLHRPLCFEIRIRILRELASALSYLHHDCSPPIVHCDIKPQNVLLDDDMTVKLSDFGISQVMTNLQQTAQKSFSSSHAIRGSIGYIAPEYGLGGPVSTEGDVYSFGVVILELMTRTPPTDDMFGVQFTLPKWVSMLFEGNTEEENKERLKKILTKVDEDGGGINIEKEEELEAVQGILKMGLRCTSEVARLRPTMMQLELILSAIFDAYVCSSTIHDIENHMKIPMNFEELLNKIEAEAADMA